MASYKIINNSTLGYKYQQNDKTMIDFIPDPNADLLIKNAEITELFKFLDGRDFMRTYTAKKVTHLEVRKLKYEKKVFRAKHKNKKKSINTTFSPYNIRINKKKRIITIFYKELDSVIKSNYKVFPDFDWEHQQQQHEA